MELTNELEKINFRIFQINNLVDVLDFRMCEKDTIQERDRCHTLVAIIQKELKELSELQDNATRKAMNLKV